MNISQGAKSDQLVFASRNDNRYWRHRDSLSNPRRIPTEQGGCRGEGPQCGSGELAPPPRPVRNCG